jgi:hypothetical protein
MPNIMDLSFNTQKHTTVLETTGNLNKYTTIYNIDKSIITIANDETTTINIEYILENYKQNNKNLAIIQ